MAGGYIGDTERGLKTWTQSKWRDPNNFWVCLNVNGNSTQKQVAHDLVNCTKKELIIIVAHNNIC